MFIDHWSIYLQSFGLVGWAVDEITLVVDWKMLSIVSDDLRSQCGTAVAQPTQAALHSVPDRCVQSVQCVVSICHPEFICCRLQSVTFVLCVRQDNQRIKITRKESSKWIFYALKWNFLWWWINCIFLPRDSGWFHLFFGWYSSVEFLQYMLAERISKIYNTWGFKRNKDEASFQNWQGRPPWKTLKPFNLSHNCSEDFKNI